MKKTVFILVIVSFLGACFSQNPHFAFWIDNYPISSSAITIVHNNAKAYLIQTESNRLHVSEINPTNMNTLYTTISYDFGNLNNLYLNGGYEDLQGNLITYGYGYYNNFPYGLQKHYLIIKIDISSVDLKYVNFSGGEIIEGCCGYDADGNICNLFLLSDGNNNNEIIACNESLTLSSTQSFKTGFGVITDISWNSHDGIFIASGSTPTNHIDPFLIYLKCGNGYPCFFYVEDSLRVSNPHFFLGAEGRTLHEVIGDRHLILIKDLRDTISDYIWIIRIDDYLNLPVLNSKIFRLPQPKLILQDMKYDPYHNKLTILGRNILCVNGTNIIAQIDPYSLTNLNIAQIKDQNFNSICTVGSPANVFYGNDIYLQKMELNPFNSCHTILSTGIIKRSKWGTSPYITETYDIATSNCDHVFHTNEQNSPLTILTPPPGVCSYFPPITPSTMNTVPSLYLNQHIVCNDIFSCDKGTVEPKKNNQITKLVPSISLYSCNYFECNHFSETVCYYLYDLAGKKLYQGTTENGIKTLLPNLSNGIYILSVIDEVGNQKSKKVLYFK